MSTDSSLSERLYFILNITMVLIYAGSGIAIYFWETPSFPESTRKILSLTLLIYSIYRGFNLFRKIKKTPNEK